MKNRAKPLTENSLIKLAISNPKTLIGKSIRSWCCKGRKQKIYYTEKMFVGGVDTVQIRSKCDCKTIIFSHVGYSDNHHYYYPMSKGFSVEYIKWMDKLLKDPQRKANVAKVEKYLRKYTKLHK